jgi:hypothetical protein
MSEDAIIVTILLVIIFFIVVQRILNKQENSTTPKKNSVLDMKPNFTTTNKSSRVYPLQLTNTIIYVLSIFGSIGFIVFGWKRGECVNNCGSWDAEYIADPFMIIVGVAALLTSTLTFQVINVFALFVEKSISK